MRKRLKTGRKTTCSKCNNPIEPNRLAGSLRYCKSCHNAYMRANRLKHSELPHDQKIKSRCRSYFNVYLKRGKVVKQPCAVCGDNNSQAHHDDYTKPLDVVWICRRHHLELHLGKQVNI